MSIVTITNYEVIVETDKVFGVWDGKSHKGWGTKKLLVRIPKQDVKGKTLCEKIDNKTITMPEWLAKSKGLITCKAF